jgi:hypothetical protein
MKFFKYIDHLMESETLDIWFERFVTLITLGFIIFIGALMALLVISVVCFIIIWFLELFSW